MNTLASAPQALFYPAPKGDTGLVGLPRLMEMAFRGIDLDHEARALIERVERDPEDANALMDLSCIMFLVDRDELALRLQAEALSISRCYTLPASGTERLRLLTLMTPGALMGNIPVEFLVHGSDVTLEMVYLKPDSPSWLVDLPPHDVACIGVCVSPTSRPLLEALARSRPGLSRATLNDPIRILGLERETVWRRLLDVPGCQMPPSTRVDRTSLMRLVHGDTELSDLLQPGAAFPIICRPRGSHAGQGLARIDDPSAMQHYLATASGDDFVVSQFIDYISPDHQYRKYRVAFVGGRTYPVHMALSARWMVHYLNGDMTHRSDNRAEEQRFFDQFDHGFGRRHAAALAAIDERLGLDYYSIDCSETPDGRLLVFECDTGGVAHAMDPLEDFGYKRPHMLRLFGAFRALLMRATTHPCCLKPKTVVAPTQ